MAAIATEKWGDSPKWREFPELANSTDVIGIVGSGGFPEKSPFTVPVNRTAENFAPRHFLQNTDRYKYLLENPYGNRNFLFQFG